MFWTARPWTLTIWMIENKAKPQTRQSRKTHQTMNPTKDNLQEFLEAVGEVAHGLPEDLRQGHAMLVSFLADFGLDDFWETPDARGVLDELVTGLEIEVKAGRLSWFEDEPAPAPAPAKQPAAAAPAKAEKTRESKHAALAQVAPPPASVHAAPVETFYPPRRRQGFADKPAQPIPTPGLPRRWHKIEQVARTMSEDFSTEHLISEFGSVRAFSAKVEARLAQMGKPYSFSTVYNVIGLLGFADGLWAGRGASEPVRYVLGLYPDGISERRVVARHGSFNALADAVAGHFGRKKAWGHAVIRRALVASAMDV